MAKPKLNEKDHRTSIGIPATLHKWIKECAEKNCRPISREIVFILKEEKARREMNIVN